MPNSVMSAETKAEKRFAADCYNVQTCYRKCTVVRSFNYSKLLLFALHHQFHYLGYSQRRQAYFLHSLFYY